MKLSEVPFGGKFTYKEREYTHQGDKICLSDTQSTLVFKEDVEVECLDSPVEVDLDVFEVQHTGEGDCCKGEAPCEGEKGFTELGEDKDDDEPKSEGWEHITDS